MAYCKFQADQLFTGNHLYNGDHVLVTDDNGLIMDIIPVTEAGADIKKYSGILMPGIINAHCHLELSHMRHQIAPGGGLTQFIGAVMKTRQAGILAREEAMRQAADEMYQHGIVAVGDICNNTSSLSVKGASRIGWYNFLEITNLDDSQAAGKMEAFKKMQAAFEQTTPGSIGNIITPHAPYSISPQTFQLINQCTAGGTICIHNQETAAENELFKTGTGAFLDFYKSIGRSESPIKASGKTSLQTWLPYFTQGQSIILVHNTFIQEEDLAFAQGHARMYGLTLYFCICANANLYIENRLPPVDLLQQYGCSIILGTDSYSSNWQLNIMKEVTTLHQHFPQIKPATLLQWATLNGAQALGIQRQWGSFEKNKKPGVLVASPGLEDVVRLI